MISVCMATYNGERYLLPQLQSILSQLGPDDELIISDDGSTDATLSMIEGLGDARIRLFHNERHGFDDLIGCEAFAAFLTFSAAAYGAAFVCRA